MPLSHLRRRHLARAGSKAVTLGQLLRAGLPVPLGFVITTRAFQNFLHSSPKWKELGRALSQCRADDAVQTAELSQTCEEALLALRIPEMLDLAVRRAVEQCPHVERWAVRSSGTAEDLPQASFAGQYESLLNVATADILEQVRRCWMSLFSPRALAYRLHKQIPHEGSAMAVIVQQMIPADVAGVLFTSDPNSGDPYRIVLEGIRGLGDRVVSGHARPERVVVSKASLEVLERNGSAEGDPHPVSDDLARQLAQLGLDVEQLLGYPADIEWAACRNQILVLQARPITARPQARTWEDRQLWTNLNTGEGFPDVTTPATWSVLQRFIDPLIRGLFSMSGADLGAHPVIGLVAGRVYFNVNTGLAAIKPFPSLIELLSRVGRTLGGGQIDASCRVLRSVPKEDLPDLGFRWHKYLLSLPGILLDVLRHSPRRGDAWTLRLKARINELTKAQVETMPIPELMTFFHRLVQNGFKDWDLLYLCTQGMALAVFEFACRKWLHDPKLTTAYRLFSGLGGMAEAEAGLALWRLATVAHGDEQAEAALTAGRTWTETVPELQQTEAGRRFISAWNAFMTEHGHHARGELELYNARWRETPDYILGLVRGYIRSMPRVDPLENQSRLAKERRELTGQCLRRLKNPFKRWLFSRALGRAQKVALNREEWRNQAVRQMAVLRRVLLQLGQRLWQQGVLSQSDDIFFLEIAEIESVLSGNTAENAPSQLREKIRSRRAEYAQNVALSPPQFVIGKFTSTPTQPSRPLHNGKVFEGLAVSPGIATGRAKVILRNDNHEQVLPGEILIAPFTDPSWTPYFVTAAGVVTDQGGILSHGSVVAREYGLPAVTDVGCATLRIQTGTLVQVDGNSGRVTVLE